MHKGLEKILTFGLGTLAAASIADGTYGLVTRPFDTKITSKKPISIELTIDNHVNEEHFLHENMTSYSESKQELFQVPEHTYPIDVNEYDGLILEYTEKWNHEFARFGMKPLNPNRVKAMTVVESGSHPIAHKKDPMQIANEGDYGLDIVAGRTDEPITTLLPDDMITYFRSKKHTPHVSGFRDYSNNNMDGEASIEGGILTLISKNAIFDDKYSYDEVGETKSYTVQSGDSLWDIAVANNTSVETLRKYNDLDSNDIFKGQELQFKEVEAYIAIVGWKGWDVATKDYNGGGVDDYLERVKVIEHTYMN